MAVCGDPCLWATLPVRHLPRSCSCCCWRAAGRIAAATPTPIRSDASTSTRCALSRRSALRSPLPPPPPPNYITFKSFNLNHSTHFRAQSSFKSIQNSFKSIQNSFKFIQKTTQINSKSIQNHSNSFIIN